MPTQAGVYNMALGHLSVADTVDTPADTGSEAAAACNTYWEVCIGTVLEARDWNFCKRRAPLVLIQEDPNSDWSYEYAMPANCGRIIRLVEPGAQDVAPPVTYEQRWDGTQRVIWTNLRDAEVEYVDASFPIGYWPASFSLAVSYLLASLIAPRVRGSQAAAEKAYAQFQMAVGTSIAGIQSQANYAEEPDAEAIRARGG